MTILTHRILKSRPWWTVCAVLLLLGGCDCGTAPQDWDPTPYDLEIPPFFPPMDIPADNPLTEGKKPLLTCDVWEHAYYIDFRNARPKYLDTFFESLVNWDFVASNL